MAQNLYPPMALLKKTAQQYPKAWELMANFHAENGMNGLPTWPDWCYAPMSAAVAIASGGRNFTASLSLLLHRSSRLVFWSQADSWLLRKLGI